MYDLRLGYRSLRRSPLYAVATVFIIALGIGSAATVFTFVDGLLLRPLPVTDPERLVRIWKTDPVRGFEHYPPIYPEIDEWAGQVSGAESVAVIGGWGPYEGILRGSGESERLRIDLVSANFFDVVGVKAADGRTFRAEDESATAVPPIVLSHGLWRRRFGADPEIVGKTLGLDFQRKPSYQVVGVLPERFDLGTGADAWAPALAVNPQWAEDRGCECDAVARLAAGVSRERLEAELQGIHERMASDRPKEFAEMRVVVRPLLETVVGRTGPAALLLLGSVLVLVALSSINLAGLSLAQAARRKRHLAVQLALGADRAALVRQKLVEGTILSGVGLALGLALASTAVTVVLSWKGMEIPRSDSIGFGLRPVLFSFLVLAGTLVVSSLYPALSATRGELARLLQSRMVGSGDRRVTSFAAAAQVALAVVLLTGAGLLVRTFEAKQSIDRGLSSERLLSVGVRLPDTRYSTPEARLQFIEALVSEVEALPGVDAVTPMFMRPGSGSGGYSGPFQFEGQAPDEWRSNPMANFEWIAPNYFRTLGIPLLQGRVFEERDLSSGERVAIVSQATAETHWPGEDPIGKTLGWEEVRHRVVGVVADLRYRELTRNWLCVYFPLGQNPFSTDEKLHPAGVPGLLAVRTRGEPELVIPLIRNVMARMEPDAPRDSIVTMDSLFDKELVAPRLNAFLLSFFSVVAGALAAVGLYSLFAASVAERLPELGLRLALGATPSRLLGMVWKEVSRLASAGILAGLFAALVLSRFVERFLFGVESTDPLTYVVVVVLFWLVALGATYVPAKRASRVDPLSLLRSD